MCRKYKYGDLTRNLVALIKKDHMHWKKKQLSVFRMLQNHPEILYDSDAVGRERGTGVNSLLWFRIGEIYASPSCSEEGRSDSARGDALLRCAI